MTRRLLSTGGFCQQIQELGPRLYQATFSKFAVEFLRRLGFEDAMDYRRISEFERGTTEPHLSVLLQYARAAGVPMEDIVDDELDLPDRLPGNMSYQGIRRSTTSHQKR